MERARKVYLTALNLVPHKQFTFAKLWLQYAHFEIRQHNLDAARKSLGRAIGAALACVLARPTCCALTLLVDGAILSGMCPKDKLFKGYIELELQVRLCPYLPWPGRVRPLCSSGLFPMGGDGKQLREFDRCRTLYEKYLEFNPANVYAWIKYAELEKLLEEVCAQEARQKGRDSHAHAGGAGRGAVQEDRCRGVFELAISQPLLDMPELLWKAYIGPSSRLGALVSLLHRSLVDMLPHPPFPPLPLPSNRL